MPPRWFCAFVIIVWVGITGWLAWSEVTDEFGPDAFVIDFTDDVQPDRSPVHWDVMLVDLDDEGMGKREAPYMAVTRIDYDDKPDETFTFNVEMKPKQASTKPLPLGLLALKYMKSAYRVTRDRRLLDLKVSITFVQANGNGEGDCQLDLNGAVADGQFTGNYDIRMGNLQLPRQDIGPVPVTEHGSVLMPMHPVHKIYNLRPGMTWRVPLVNPVADALASSLGSSSRTRFLRAHVLPTLQLLELPDGKSCLCHVIEYEGDEDTKPRTWVRAADGVVLRQEMALDGKRLIMVRPKAPEALP